MDQAASEDMLGEIQAIRSDIEAVAAPETLAQVDDRVLGALLLYERFATDQVTAAGTGDEAALATSGSAFDAAQLVIGDALAALSGLGFDDCEQT
jgi:hypothetical protein